MTQEEQQLLFRVICTELPYGITVQQSAKYPKEHFAHSVADKWETEPHDFNIIGIEGTNTLITDKRKEERTHAKGIVSSPITIPIHNGFTGQEIKPYLRPMSSMTEEEKKEQYKFSAFNNVELFDWLNVHHFDYRGLIEKGLALEAPKEMYA